MRARKTRDIVICKTKKPFCVFQQEFAQKLGTGAYKCVWLGYDTEMGIEVAWNTVDMRRVPKNERKRLKGETEMLKSLKHPHIINFFNVWENKEEEQICFTTEIVTSGTLKQYIDRVFDKGLKLKIVKKWCRQILEGLKYLHSHNPPIIHRDIKCDNIFINGSTGDIIIGDLGLSTHKVKTHAESVLGTPEFMAPELYDEHYTEKVDIWAFGCSLLEMVTNEYPYQECDNSAQIFKRVSQQIHPLVLTRIIDKHLRDFIELCLAPQARRLSARDMLEHPFLLYKSTDPRDSLNIELGPLILPTVLPVIGRIAEEPDEEVAEASDADADEHVSHRGPAPHPFGSDFSDFAVPINSVAIAATAAVITPTLPPTFGVARAAAVPNVLLTSVGVGVVTGAGSPITAAIPADVANQALHRSRSAASVTEGCVVNIMSVNKNNTLNLSLRLIVNGTNKDIKFLFDCKCDTPLQVATEMLDSLRLDPIRRFEIANGLDACVRRHIDIWEQQRASKPRSQHLPSRSAALTVLAEVESIGAGVVELKSPRAIPKSHANLISPRFAGIAQPQQLPPPLITLASTSTSIPILETGRTESTGVIISSLPILPTDDGSEPGAPTAISNHLSNSITATSAIIHRPPVSQPQSYVTQPGQAHPNVQLPIHSSVSFSNSASLLPITVMPEYGPGHERNSATLLLALPASIDAQLSSTTTTPGIHSSIGLPTLLPSNTSQRQLPARSLLAGLGVSLATLPGSSLLPSTTTTYVNGNTVTHVAALATPKTTFGIELRAGGSSPSISGGLPVRSISDVGTYPQLLPSIIAAAAAASHGVLAPVPVPGSLALSRSVSHPNLAGGTVVVAGSMGSNIFDELDVALTRPSLRINANNATPMHTPTPTPNHSVAVVHGSTPTGTPTTTPAQIISATALPNASLISSRSNSNGNLAQAHIGIASNATITPALGYSTTAMPHAISSSVLNNLSGSVVHGVGSMMTTGVGPSASGGVSGPNTVLNGNSLTAAASILTRQQHGVVGGSDTGVGNLPNSVLTNSIQRDIQNNDPVKIKQKLLDKLKDYPIEDIQARISTMLAHTAAVAIAAGHNIGNTVTEPTAGLQSSDRAVLTQQLIQLIVNASDPANRTQAPQPLQRQISPPIALTPATASLGPIRPTPSQTTTTVPVIVQSQTSNIVGISNPANTAVAVSNQIQFPSMASVVSSVPMFHATGATSVARPAHHYINANLTVAVPITPLINLSHMLQSSTASSPPLVSTAITPSTSAFVNPLGSSAPTNLNAAAATNVVLGPTPPSNLQLGARTMSAGTRALDPFGYEVELRPRSESFSLMPTTKTASVAAAASAIPATMPSLRELHSTNTYAGLSAVNEYDEFDQSPPTIITTNNVTSTIASNHSSKFNSNLTLQAVAQAAQTHPVSGITPPLAPLSVQLLSECSVSSDTGSGSAEMHEGSHSASRGDVHTPDAMYLTPEHSESSDSGSPTHQQDTTRSWASMTSVSTFAPKTSNIQRVQPRHASAKVVAEVRKKLLSSPDQLGDVNNTRQLEDLVHLLDLPPTELPLTDSELGELSQCRLMNSKVEHMIELLKSYELQNELAVKQRFWIARHRLIPPSVLDMVQRLEEMISSETNELAAMSALAKQHNLPPSLVVHSANCNTSGRGVAISTPSVTGSTTSSGNSSPTEDEHQRVLLSTVMAELALCGACATQATMHLPPPISAPSMNVMSLLNPAPSPSVSHRLSSVVSPSLIASSSSPNTPAAVLNSVGLTAVPSSRVPPISAKAATLIAQICPQRTRINAGLPTSVASATTGPSIATTAQPVASLSSQRVPISQLSLRRIGSTTSLTSPGDDSPPLPSSLAQGSPLMPQDSLSAFGVSVTNCTQTTALLQRRVTASALGLAAINRQNSAIGSIAPPSSSAAFAAVHSSTSVTMQSISSPIALPNRGELSRNNSQNGTFMASNHFQQLVNGPALVVPNPQLPQQLGAMTNRDL